MALAQPHAPSAPDAPASAQGAPAEGRPRRRLRNYLLDSGLQLRLASYLLAAAALLAAGMGALLWRAYRETSRVVELGDPELGASLGALLAQEDRARMVVLAAGLALVLGCLLAAAVVVTHRIAGPAFAIRRTCRRVAEGDLSPAPPLRARDLLVDLADEVAGMVAALREREAGEREAVARAAAVLRDPAAPAAERAEAAAALERLAAEKARRLDP